MKLNEFERLNLKSRNCKSLNCQHFQYKVIHFFSIQTLIFSLYLVHCTLYYKLQCFQRLYFRDSKFKNTNLYLTIFENSCPTIYNSTYWTCTIYIQRIFFNICLKIDINSKFFIAGKQETSVEILRNVCFYLLPI